MIGTVWEKKKFGTFFFFFQMINKGLKKKEEEEKKTFIGRCSDGSNKTSIAAVRWVVSPLEWNTPPTIQQTGRQLFIFGLARARAWSRIDEIPVSTQREQQQQQHTYIQSGLEFNAVSFPLFWRVCSLTIEDGRCAGADHDACQMTLARKYTTTYLMMAWTGIDYMSTLNTYFLLPLAYRIVNHLRESKQQGITSESLKKDLWSIRWRWWPSVGWIAGRMRVRIRVGRRWPWLQEFGVANFDSTPMGTNDL